MSASDYARSPMVNSSRTPGKKPSVLCSVGIGMALSTAVAVFVVFRSMGMAPAGLVLVLFLAGLPLSALFHYSQLLTSADSGGKPSAIRKSARSSVATPKGALLILLTTALLAALWVGMFPPASQIFETTNWSGSTFTTTRYARLNTAGARSMHIDMSMLKTECLLIAGALLSGLSPLISLKTKLDPDHLAALMIGRAASVLHLSILFLPSLMLGSDTIGPGALSPISLPNLVSFALVCGNTWLWKFGTISERNAAPGYHLGFAILWSAAVLLVALVADGRILGGSIFAAAALWFSFLSAKFQTAWLARVVWTS